MSLKSDLRLTAAQAFVRYLCAQSVDIDGSQLPLFAGVWAIFGHGNVAGLGEALYGARSTLPTLRAHNEQAMAHAAIAYAKASKRRRMMACTTSIGPGATNLVTAAAVAHVNRLPVLLVPGDVFANRRPDPVLQQIEDFGDATVTANDCLRPVSRYFDRITRPEQLLAALPRALQTLTDPADCGPATIAFCQDVQAEAYAYPSAFFEPRTWVQRRPPPDAHELRRAIGLLTAAKKPLIICGGGVHYADAVAELVAFAGAFGIPVAETQAGKSALHHDDAASVGAIGVTGTAAANALAAQADVVLAIGTRLQDFTTGSRTLFQNPSMTLICMNIQAVDAGKHGGSPLVCDAKVGLAAVGGDLRGWQGAPPEWRADVKAAKAAWEPVAATALAATAPAATNLAATNLAATNLAATNVAATNVAATNVATPSDAQVIGAVQRTSGPDTIVVCAAGGLPGELHKLWPAVAPGSYHLEYGYSCMGYEIAGGLGVKLARPDSDVIVMVGDGSYLMMNSEIATSVAMGRKLTIVVLDNRGYGCINRLQHATGGAAFNNLLADTVHDMLPDIDFVKNAESLGASACKAGSIKDLEQKLRNAKGAEKTTVIVIDTDPVAATAAGGHWWDVAVPEVSAREAVGTARSAYVDALTRQRLR